MAPRQDQPAGDGFGAVQVVEVIVVMCVGVVRGRVFRQFPRLRGDRPLTLDADGREADVSPPMRG